MDSILPNNPSVNDPQGQNTQQSNQPSDQPYGLDFQPLAPTGGEHAPIVEPVLESAPQQTETISELQKPTETLATPEIEQNFPMPTAAQVQEDQNPIILQPIAKEEVKVVNKTDTLTTLHHVIDTPDPLTKEADQDEEHFIEEVEKHHGH